MQTFLYRRGNGNDGNYVRAIIDLKDSDCPYAALSALVANDYIPGTATRRHIMRNIEIDDEAAYGIYATVFESKDGESEYGSAWLTAELQVISEEDVAYESGSTSRRALRDALDNGALTYFRRLNKISR